MKKVLKLLVAIILAIVILGFVMFLIDCSRVNSDKVPIFARETSTANDGGTIEYMGLGYKIIDFNRLNGYDETKIGLWNMKYEDFKEEYNKLDKNIIEDKTEDNEIEETISGDEIDEESDILLPENISGDFVSGEIDKIEFSGERDGAVSDNFSGDEIIEEYYFNAKIIGINENSLVVQALEDEAINASADMFSFSLNEDTSEFFKGQKVRIKYTGNIRETYPAQIDVTEIKIIE